MEHDDRHSAIAALHRGLELGMTHIDTAEMYGSGEVERLVGEVLRGKREHAFVASKVLPANASFRGVIRACEASLRRLGIAELDLYLLHWPGDHPLEDTLSAFEELRQKGKIRFWGVSNFDERELSAAVRMAGAGAVACNQVLYHLGERASEHRVIPFCEEHDIAVVAYSPFGSGDFPSSASQGGRVLDAIAAARGVTARQVALAFLVHGDALFAIPKASRVAHVLDNAGAGEIELTADELARIDEAFPRGRPRRGVPMI